jgi:16S rRNA (guanine527-N7)-methyltransferase
VKHRGDEVARLVEACGALGVVQSEAQAGRLLRFEGLLRDLALPRGMIAASDGPRLRKRHVLDCLRAASLVASAGSAYDLGSGAGLPGVVVAIAVPTLQVGLVESRGGRVAFLERALEELELANARVLAARVEDLSEPVDVCFARAFAPADQAWRAARPLLAPGGRLVYFASGATQIEHPEGASVVTLRTPVLESSGPLVIMSRP